MADCNIIPFPEQPKLPDIESFPIYLNHDTNEILMPYVPDNKDDAVNVLAVFMDILLEDEILKSDDILQTALQVVDSTGDES